MSIVEKMARAMFENTPVYKDSTRERRWGWADFPCDDIDPRRYLLGQARAALTATGLTEAQLEGLANGTHVVISRQSLTEMHAALIACDEDGMTEHAECMVEAGTLVNRAMLAAKEG